jgi:hypothetical protein
MVSTYFIYPIECCDRTIFNLVFFYYIKYNNINIKKETTLKRATKSLLEELNSVSSQKNSEAIVESRATHVINSAINLLNSIRENFSPEQAYELERRLINSIKTADPTKFTRGIRKLRDNKEIAKSFKIIEGNVKDED